MVGVEVIIDGLGVKRFKVYRIFSNEPAAERGASALGAVSNEAFEPVAPAAMAAPAPPPTPPLPDPEREDDTGEPYTVPGCANGMCGMD